MLSAFYIFNAKVNEKDSSVQVSNEFWFLGYKFHHLTSILIIIENISSARNLNFGSVLIG